MGSNKQQTPNLIGIRVEPLQSRIGASKYIKSDWTMEAFVLPRSSLGLTFADKELQYNSIYFLFGYDGPTEKVYVGQAKKRNGGGSVLLRLREHDKSTTEPYRDIWQYAIVITSINDDWGPTELNNLEHLFYQAIPAKNNLNGNNPNFGGIDQDTDYSEKIRQAKTYIKAIGLQIFDDTEEAEKIQVESVINDYSTVEDLQNGMARIPEIITPQKVVKSMIDMLPKELFNLDTTFLDLACKGGEYLRELYDRLMETESLIAAYPDEFERSNHILGKQLFGIALSQVSMDRTIKSLKGFDHNIKVIPSYISYIKDKKDETGQFRTLINRELGQMKFDVVIGNPPYQESTGGGTGKGTGSALYDKFMQKASKLGRYTCMIVPLRWMMCGAQGVDKKWAYDELHSKKYRNLVYFKDSKEIFGGVDIRGGVAYFLRDEQYKGYCDIVSKINNKVESHQFRLLADDNVDNFIENVLAISIVNKCKSKKTFDQIVGAVHAYGIETNTVTFGRGIKLYRNYGQIEECSIEEIPRQYSSIYKYKVIAVYAFGKGLLGERVPVPKVIGPMEICSATYLVVGESDDRNICENICKYM